MSVLRFSTTFALIFLFLSAGAQKLKKADKLTLANLHKHVAFLADDKLEGRRPGTNGETLAMNYISENFSASGLQPKGTNGYFQPFDIYDGKQIGQPTSFAIEDRSLQLNTDFFPFAFSANGELQARPSLALQEADMPWFLNLQEELEDNKDNPHFDAADFVKTKAAEAQKKGASALIVYNTSSINDHLGFNTRDRTEALNIPVIYVTKKAAEKYFNDPAASIDIAVKVTLADKKRTGHNVIGYIDNNVAHTVILGAHFDHLGYGEDNNSMLRTGEKLIHNGADDNASGTAALLELARIIKKSKIRNTNFLFIAFSAEELGLFGSKYFADNPTIDLKSVSYMINMDMVGRLNDSTHTLTIGGYGTAPEWSAYIVPDGKKNPFSIKVDSSGSGPSDHTSFYRKGIPVLFFFTGLHPDYHRPSDDADKINYRGELQIVNYITRLVSSLSKNNQSLTFTKTRETQTTTSARFKVTLGIMPDYAFSGSGVRCDGVSEGRPAQKAGLKTGDIITQLGDIKITSMETYMQALGKFKKGDKTKIVYKRGEEQQESEIEF